MPSIAIAKKPTITLNVDEYEAQMAECIEEGKRIAAKRVWMLVDDLMAWHWECERQHMESGGVRAHLWSCISSVTGKTLDKLEIYKAVFETLGCHLEVVVEYGDYRRIHTVTLSDSNHCVMECIRCYAKDEWL